MFIAKIAVKLMILHWKRFVLFLCLAALLCTATGLLGNSLLYGDAKREPISLLIVDEDNSLETRMLYDNIAAADYGDLLTFSKADLPSATASLQKGEAVAAIVLPSGFAQSIMTGENKPFTMLYSASSPLRAQMIKLYADAFAKTLATSQIGVYTSLAYAAEYGDAQQYEDMFLLSNMGYLGLFGQRLQMAASQQLSAAGELDVFSYYVVHALILLLTLTPILLLDILRPLYSPAILGELYRLGVHGRRIAAGSWVGILPLYACVGALSAGLLWLTASSAVLYILPGLAAIAAAISALCICGALLFQNPSGGGIILSVCSLMGFLVSGGVLPSDYLAPTLQLLGRCTFQFWATRLISAGLESRFDWLALLLVLGFGALYFLAAMCLLQRRRRA